MQEHVTHSTGLFGELHRRALFARGPRCKIRAAGGSCLQRFEVSPGAAVRGDETGSRCAARFALGNSDAALATVSEHFSGRHFATVRHAWEGAGPAVTILHA
jgi:hypothetical protein